MAEMTVERATEILAHGEWFPAADHVEASSVLVAEVERLKAERDQHREGEAALVVERDALWQHAAKADAEIERLKAEKEWLTHQAISLCRYAATGKLRNEQEWMRGLADRINDVLRELGDSSRVRFLVTEFRVESIKAAEAAGGDA